MAGGRRWMLVGAVAAVVVLANAALGYYYYRTYTGLAGAVGVAAAEIIEDSEGWVLVSLYPYDYVSEQDNPEDWNRFGLAERPKFGSFYELGRVKLSAAECERLRDAIAAGIIEGGEPAMCYWPRHAILMNHGGKEYTLEVCFQCSQGELKNIKSFLVSKSPAAAFNEVLDDHGTLREGK